MKAIVITLIVVCGLVGLANIGVGQTSPKKLVFDMCQQARISNTVSEQTCGDLQDHFGMEYLCTQNNDLRSNNCWVEVK